VKTLPRTPSEADGHDGHGHDGADGHDARPLTRGARIFVFVGVCIVAAVLAIGALVVARRDRDRRESQATPVELAPSGAGDTVVGDAPVLLFESTALGDTYGYVASVTATTPGGARTVSDLQCERVHFRSGTGVCLRADRGMITTYDALVFDADMHVRHTIGLAGAPSRVRVSPDGSLAGVTVFVTGHSYADGNFSTQTTLIDLAAGDVLADLETDFDVIRDGEVWRAIDFNFWGVTFVDAHHFYATLGTGGRTYLVEGDVDSREMVVVHDDVECPALSPDGKRIAFKLRSDGGGLQPLTWRIAVLDLASSEVTVLAETRNVDDQVEWLDDGTVMYGLTDEQSPAETDTWTVPADGTGAPTLFVPRAWSATLVP
jgi:WD40-like Beta Propeller Repeat